MPDNPFIDVARAIADPAPEWLAPYLEQFSAYVGIERPSKKDRQWAKQNIAEMHRSIDHLIRWLPALAMLPGLGRIPDVAADVSIAIPALSRLKAELNRRPQFDGRPPNNQQQWCADVIVQAFQDLKGNVEPKSTAVLSACAAYWQACRQPERDDDNWGRNTTDALAKPNEVVQTLLNYHKART
jgi:hypothetical protein